MGWQWSNEKDGLTTRPFHFVNNNMKNYNLDAITAKFNISIVYDVEEINGGYYPTNPRWAVDEAIQPETNFDNLIERLFLENGIVIPTI